MIDAMIRYYEPVVCPSCKSRKSRLIDRKYIFTRLFECSDCYLAFRHPIDTEDVNRSFYQTQYEQKDGVTTFMPDGIEDLESLKNSILTDVKNPKNAQRIRIIFDALFSTSKNLSIVDYGASWGYLSWQFKSFGALVQSYEISVPRANFGKKLGLSILTDESLLVPGNDVFFSSHVIEHVPSVANMLQCAKYLVSETGAIITLCPNGSPEFREVDPVAFHRCWGKVHPNFLNPNFFLSFFADNPVLITTTPFDYDLIKYWDKASHCIGNLAGEELLTIVFPKQTISNA